MKRLLTLHLAALLMFTHVASANGVDFEAAPIAPAPTPAENSAANVKVCETNLAAVYKPVGYVTGALVNRFSKETPFLFTDLYFRVIGATLYKHGFEKIVNAKGIFLDHISDTDRSRAIGILTGKSEENIQRQGRIAIDVWNRLEEAFKLREVVDSTNSVAAAKKAYYTSVDDYLATRDFFLGNLQYKREVIELIRLSMPFGIRMALNDVTRSDGKAIFVTTAATIVSATVAFVMTQLLKMLGTPDPGMTAMLVTAAAAPTIGVATYLYTAPKSHFRKLHLKLMNWANRRALAKQGLISKEDGESTLFIKAAFRDLKDLRNEVSVNDIRAVIPIPPSNVDEKTVLASMGDYAKDLARMLATVTAHQEIVTTEMTKQARMMGEPVATLGRLLQMKGDATAHAIPDNARLAIDEYSKNVSEAVVQVTEIEEKLSAIVAQYEIHRQVLEGYLSSNEGRMQNPVKLAIERKLAEIRTANLTVSTIVNVALTQKSGLASEQRALEAALLTIASVQADKVLSVSQAAELNKALWALTNRVDEAHANVIADGEKVPTPQAPEGD